MTEPDQDATPGEPDPPESADEPTPGTGDAGQTERADPGQSDDDAPGNEEQSVLDRSTSTGVADTGEDGGAEPGEPTPQPVLEMRQVAGLTAGSVMELHVGSFQFHESESDVGFAIVVDEAEASMVVPGSAAAHVDEVPLTEPSPLDDSVLNVGSACFTVRPHRSPPTQEGRLAALEETKRGPGAITVPDLTVAADGPTQNRSSRFGALFSRSDGEAETLDHRWWSFLETIREARSLVAERHRWQHPDPEELRSRLDRLDPGLWDRTRQHPLFGRIALAYATVPWEPRFDDPERIPTELHGLIREMSQLPWVPVTANLSHGPLGIVGTRAATLAATRHAVLSLACLTAPSDLSFSIVTAKGLIDSWSWTSALPNSLFADGRPNAFPVAIADGMVHFDGAGLAHEAVLSNELGLIALAETVDELPDYCATVLHIGSDGRCMVTNHLGDQIQGTPIGVTAKFAAKVAAALTEAIGDDDTSFAEAKEAPPPPPERPSRTRAPADRASATGIDSTAPGPSRIDEGDTGIDDDDYDLDEVAAAVAAASAAARPSDEDEPRRPAERQADDSGHPGADDEDGEYLADDFANELSEMFGPGRDS